jgi:hypothetical protein
MEKGLLDLLYKVKSGWISVEHAAYLLKLENEIKLLKQKLNQAS